MMISNTYLMIFAMAMTGCVLATPLVTWVATWVGAIDRPDQFRQVCRLERAANEAALVDECDPHRRDDRANLGKHIDQVLLRQQPQSLAYRLAAHTYGKRDSRFGKRGAGCQLSGHYGIA